MENQLSSETIASGLKTKVIGQRIIYYDQLPSTMDAAREAARQRCPEGTTVITGEQTAGRGRLGRTWFSPDGGIALSIVLYPALNLLPSLIMLASLAVLHCITDLTGLNAGIKWPNDVLINGRKVCGILIENQFRGNNPDYAVIGIGLNVNIDPDRFPDIAATATSLERETRLPVSRPELIRQLLTEADRLYACLLERKSLFPEWRSNLITLGQAVRASDGQDRFEGTAESVAEDGSLWIRLTNGERVRVVAGEVTLRC